MPHDRAKELDGRLEGQSLEQRGSDQKQRLAQNTRGDQRWTVLPANESCQPQGNVRNVQVVFGQEAGQLDDDNGLELLEADVRRVVLVDGEQAVDGGQLQSSVVLAQEGGEQGQGVREKGLQVDFGGRVGDCVEGLDGREARYFVSEALDEDGPAGAQLMLNGAAQVADDLSP